MIPEDASLDRMKDAVVDACTPRVGEHWQWSGSISDMNGNAIPLRYVVLSLSGQNMKLGTPHSHAENWDVHLVRQLVTNGSLMRIK